MCFSASSSFSSSHCDLHCSKKERKNDGNIIVLFEELCYIKKNDDVLSKTLMCCCCHPPLHTELCCSQKEQQCGSIMLSFSLANYTKIKTLQQNNKKNTMITTPNDKLVARHPLGSNMQPKPKNKQKNQKEPYVQALAPPLFVVLKVLLSSCSSHSSSSANSNPNPS